LEFAFFLKKSGFCGQLDDDKKGIKGSEVNFFIFLFEKVLLLHAH
jgi:hypothetical protein